MENTQAKFIYAELFGVASGSRLKSEIYVCYESLNNDHGVGYYSRRDVSQKGLLLVFFIASVITKIKNKK